MAKLSLVRATTSKLVRVFIQDSSVTTGAGLAGLAFGSAGLTAYYIIEGQATMTAITLATMTVGTWATGGFKEIDATHAPGLYEIGLPNAVLASGASVVVFLQGAANMVPCVVEIELTATNNQTADNGLSAAFIGSSPWNATTYGDALKAAWTQGVGKWAISGTTLNVYAPDGTTVLKAFTLNSSTAPTSRT